MQSVLTIPGSDYVRYYCNNSTYLRKIDGNTYIQVPYEAIKVGTNLTFTLKYPEWQDALSSNAFTITPGYVLPEYLKIELNKKEYKVGDDIIVRIHLVDKFGNPSTDFHPDNTFYINAPNATPTLPGYIGYGVQFKDWIKIDDYTYQVTYKATKVGTDLQIYALRADYSTMRNHRVYKIGDNFSIVDN
ncbi:unnamed protein product [Bartonella choladocola]|uniref:hypothetical protein n=1 Tax=Bartonella TaxID=773 RepID=UPI0018DCF7E5|nr:hypothetical protein [Bartonella choladocola]MBI0141553.1 hypothetical protein [Bartonella choladocola]